MIFIRQSSENDIHLVLAIDRLLVDYLTHIGDRLVIDTMRASAKSERHTRIAIDKNGVFSHIFVRMSVCDIFKLGQEGRNGGDNSATPNTTLSGHLSPIPGW